MRTLTSKGMAGMNAEPSWRRQAISGILKRIKLAAKPRKIPKAVHNCHDITKPPRIAAGVFSAAKTGMVEAFILWERERQYRAKALGSAQAPFPLEGRVGGLC
jgi:hypothetical protein